MKKEIQILDSNKKIIFAGTINKIPLSEELIIQKSIEFFNDSEPCYIHRFAVASRLFFEIEDSLKKLPKENTCLINIKDLPEFLKSVFITFKTATYLIY